MKVIDFIRNTKTFGFGGDFNNISIDDAKEAMIQFAKHHVKLALEAAAGNVEADFEPMGWLAEQHATEPFKAGEDYEIGINRHSVLNSYDLSNIE